MTAFVDLETKKIHGCKEGTLTYYHEQGHIAYNNSKKGALNSFREQSALQVAIYAAIVSLFIPSLKWIALILLFGHWYYFFFEEMWSWKYAFNKRRKVQYE